MRQQQFLRERYKAILGYLGFVWMIIGLFILAPLLSLIVYRDELSLAWGFLLPGAVLFTIGLVCWRLLAPKGTLSLSMTEGAVIVMFSWMTAAVVGCIPFVAVGDLTLTQALFESTSGWTTTGLSVVDVTIQPHLILLYRSTMQLAGGAGFAIFTLTVLSSPTGTGLGLAEGRGEQLEPNVRQSARVVLIIYTGYVLVGIVGLWLAGMGWFDAVNHSFCALSTGGFSTKPDSIGYWDSPAVEAVALVLMILGTTNFFTGYALLRGKFGVIWRTGEVRLMIFLIPVCMAVLLLGVTAGLYPTLDKAVRVAIFETVTALTTTGYSTVGYSDWNGLGWMVLLGLMLIGGGSGSTAGGLKHYRVYVLYRTVLWEIRRLFMPSSAVSELKVWHGGERQFLSDTAIRQIAAFAFLYLSVFFVGAAITTAYGYPLRESMFEFASTMGTVGLSSGITAADAPGSLLWVQTIMMLLGRLEFLTVFVGITKLFGDARIFAPRRG